METIPETQAKWEQRKQKQNTMNLNRTKYNPDTSNLQLTNIYIEFHTFYLLNVGVYLITQIRVLKCIQMQKLN